MVLKNRPSSEELKKFYGFDNYWHTYMTGVSKYPPIEDRAKDDFENRIPVWYDLVKRNKPGAESLLEIGCAHGGFLFHCRRNGIKTVVGVEPDERTCKFAREGFNLPNVVSGLFPEVELPLKKFDVITGFDVAEHFSDPVRAFKEVANLLKDDGTFVFQTPCYYGEDSKWAQFRPAEHLYLYNQDSIKKLFEASGLKIKEILPGYFPDDMFVTGGRKTVCRKKEADSDGGEIAGIKRTSQIRNVNLSQKKVIEAAEVKKLLIVRPDSIGDVVIFSGILKYFRVIFPKASISILVQKHIAELLEKCPYTDKVISFSRSSLFTDEIYTEGLLRQLELENFDVAINPVYSRDDTGDFLTLSCGAKITIASLGDNSNISIGEKSKNDGLYTKLVPASTISMMETSRNEEFIRRMGIKPDEAVKPQVWITDEDRAEAERLLSELKVEKPIVISPFGQFDIRNWPEYKWAALINNYEDRPVLICGSTQDYETGEQIIELTRHKRIYNLCGKTTLRQLAAVLEKSCVCIGAESAAGHIAAAAGCPNVIIIGGGHFGRFAPYSPLTSLVSLPLECYGCSWKCPYQRVHCIEDVKPRVVAEAVGQTLAEQKDKPRVFVQDTSLWKAETGEPKWEMFDKFVDTNTVEIIHLGRSTTAETRFSPEAGDAKQKDSGLTIVTSIAPKEIAKQVRAVRSWHKLGFCVVSINSREETEILQEYFPDVNFVQAKRDAKSVLGKPFVYLDDILEYIGQANSEICGIVNSDIYLSGDDNIVSFIRSEAKNSLVYGSRIEVESLENLKGEVYKNGFDFFFFDRALVSQFPKSEFCIGATWWDYWVPLTAILAGYPVKKLVSPFAYHIKHPWKWDEKQWFLLGGKLYGYLRERICEQAASGSLSGRWDLLARMLSTYAHFFIKKAEQVRNKDEYTKILYESSGPCILEFLEIESQRTGNADGQKIKSVNVADYAGADITIDISYEDYQKAVELNRYGEHQLNKGDNAGAMNSFTEAVRILPNFTAVYNNMGLLHLRKDQTEDALRYFLKTLKIDSAYIPGIINAAGVLIRGGKPDTARSLVCNSAKKFLEGGKPAKAAEVYKGYLWENSGDTEIIEALKNLSSVDSVDSVDSVEPSAKIPEGAESIPIVFVHLGDGEHLKYAIAQAHASNPKSKIYLIGDEANDKYDFVEHIDYTQYCRSAQGFERVYKHLSPNTYQFELKCFERWFVIRDFLRAKNIRGCVCPDSDIMIYTDVSEHWQRFANSGMTVSCGSSPHCNFISDVDLLDEFCSFLVQSYTAPTTLQQMEDFFAPLRGKGLEGISDMTLFGNFRQRHPGRIADISGIFNGSNFDHNINGAEGFEMENGVKKIYWVDGKPHGKLVSTGELVGFNILHFQGDAKKIIQNYFTGKLPANKTAGSVPAKAEPRPVERQIPSRQAAGSAPANGSPSRLPTLAAVSGSPPISSSVVVGEGLRNSAETDGKKSSPKEKGKTVPIEPAGLAAAADGDKILEKKLVNRAAVLPANRRYLVSAIVSTYNAEKYIKGCLDDLESQTIADRLEIIVVNSGSRQNEEKIVEKYQEKYNNIKYIKTKEREGIYAAWNRAVKAAEGEFVTNANTDDRHRRDALEVMAKTLLANNDAALVYGDQIVTKTENDSFDEHQGKDFARRPEYSRGRLLFGCCVGSQPMWRRRLHDELGYFDETLDCAGDWDFWLRVSEKFQFGHIPEFLGLYYHNESGIEHGRKIHSFYERYLVGKRYGNPYISVIPVYQNRDNPLVSVIMPAYNAAKYLKAAIESVLIQNYRNFELIVADDGSTDQTRKITEGFKDEKIKYVHKDNGGLASARNFGLKNSSGSMVVLLDADDMMAPNYISSHLEAFEKNPEADLIYCDDLLIDEQEKPIRVIKRPVYTERKFLVRDLFRCNFPVVPFRGCIRRAVFEKIGLYEEGLVVAEDFDMMRRAVKGDIVMRGLSSPLYLRRITKDSLSRTLNIEKAKCQFKVLKRFTDTFGYDELFPDVKWGKIEEAKRGLHGRALTALTYLTIGQVYADANHSLFAQTARQMACYELKRCIADDPGSERLQQMLQRCEKVLKKTPAAQNKAVCQTS